MDLHHAKQLCFSSTVHRRELGRYHRLRQHAEVADPATQAVVVVYLWISDRERSQTQNLGKRDRPSSARREVERQGLLT